MLKTILGLIRTVLSQIIARLLLCAVSDVLMEDDYDANH